MKINIIKSKIPILWIDTFAIIRMAKLTNGIKLPEHDEKRYLKLYELIIKKVNERKMVCIKGEQIEEIKFKNFLIKECDDLLIKLSVGNCSKAPRNIELLQLHIFMNAYFNNLGDININYTSGFEIDPIAELLSNKNIIISIDESFNKETIDEAQNEKQALNLKFEELRKNQIDRNVAYEQQLLNEYNSAVQATNECINNLYTKYNIAQYSDIVGIPLMYWETVSGKENDLEGLIDFYKSIYYRKMPIVDIESKLYAKILTQKYRIELGDIKDIKNIATMGTYCNMFIVDKKMKNRIKDLSIDKDYGFSVFSISDSEEIFEYIESI